MDNSFWQSHGDEVSAAITLLLAIVAAIVVDRLILGRAPTLAARAGATEMSRAATTRLRVIRRLLFITIIGFGVFLALSQFTRLERLATGVLASTAVLGLVAGFAAQHVLANMVAGVMLAITQPLRIGDLIELEQGTGRVRDITLSFTSISFDDGRVLVVPNEALMTTPLFNHSIDGTTERPVTAGGQTQPSKAAQAQENPPIDEGSGPG